MAKSVTTKTPAKAPPPPKAVASKAAAKPAPKAAAKAAPAKAVAKPAAKGKAAPAKPVPAVTVTLKQMAASYAEKHDLPKREADTILSEVFGAVVDHLKSGDRVRIGGLGIIEVKSRPARMGRNPATGAAIEIKASRKVAFRAAKELKEAI